MKKIGIKCFLLQKVAQDSIQSNAMDSVEVSLLTCSPHEEIYSLYGHTALRWHDLRSNEDLAFNWGVFDFRKPYFVLRFVFGLTDYELGTVPMKYFTEEYRNVGSSVTEQVLNLTADRGETTALPGTGQKPATREQNLPL